MHLFCVDRRRCPCGLCRGCPAAFARARPASAAIRAASIARARCSRDRTVPIAQPQRVRRVRVRQFLEIAQHDDLPIAHRQAQHRAAQRRDSRSPAVRSASGSGSTAGAPATSSFEPSRQRLSQPALTLEPLPGAVPGDPAQPRRHRRSARPDTGRPPASPPGTRPASRRRPVAGDAAHVQREPIDVTPAAGGTVPVKASAWPAAIPAIRESSLVCSRSSVSSDAGSTPSLVFSREEGRSSKNSQKAEGEGKEVRRIREGAEPCFTSRLLTFDL